MATGEALQEQLRLASTEREEFGEHPLFVADGRLYGKTNMARLDRTGVAWVCRVRSTLGATKATLQCQDVTWQTSLGGATNSWSEQHTLGQGAEHGCIVRTCAGEKQARARLLHQHTMDEAS
jgi:hypothetical protein